jgi:polyhydroxybutyrate depolymerase
LSDPNRSVHLDTTPIEHHHARKPRSLGPGTHTVHLQVGPLKRHYTVHAPPDLPTHARLPLVLFLHGGGGHTNASIRETGWTHKADAEGFLVAFLDGMPWDPSRPAYFRTNPRLWSDTTPPRDIARFNADDVGYIRAAMDDIEARFAVDRDRVYCSGFSNGGGMTFRVAVELGDRIAAIASVAAYFYLPNPTLVRPIPLIYFSGTADPMVPHLGGVSRSPWGDVPGKRPVREVVEKYAALLGCPPAPHLLGDENGVRYERYGPGDDDSEAIFVAIEGMGHLWPGGVNALPEHIVGPPTDKLVANDVIWDFFLRHPRARK